MEVGRKYRDKYEFMDLYIVGKFEPKRMNDNSNHPVHRPVLYAFFCSHIGEDKWFSTKKDRPNILPWYLMGRSANDLYTEIN